jgi:hypothetical protein
MEADPSFASIAVLRSRRAPRRRGSDLRPVSRLSARIYPLARHGAEPNINMTCMASPLRDVLRYRRTRCHHGNDPSKVTRLHQGRAVDCGEHVALFDAGSGSGAARFGLVKD